MESPKNEASTQDMLSKLEEKKKEYELQKRKQERYRKLVLEKERKKKKHLKIIYWLSLVIAIIGFAFLCSKPDSSLVLALIFVAAIYILLAIGIWKRSEEHVILRLLTAISAPAFILYLIVSVLSVTL